MEETYTYLIDQGVPIWNSRQNKYFFGDNSSKLDIVGPQFMVMFKSYRGFLHTDNCLLALKKIDRQIKFFTNPNFTFYLFINNYSNWKETINKLNTILTDCEYHQKIKIINSKESIKFTYPKYIASHETLKSFVSQHDKLYTIFKDKYIYTSQKNWNRAIVIMYSDEEILLKKYNVKILPENELIKIYNDEFCCLLTNSTTIKHDKENQFSYRITNKSLGEKPRVAIKFIKGVSEYCKTCNRLTFSKHIKDKKCSTCIRINN